MLAIGELKQPFNAILAEKAVEVFISNLFIDKSIKLKTKIKLERAKENVILNVRNMTEKDFNFVY